MQYVTSWDSPYIEAPDYPTELELVQEQYPHIDAGDYASWDDLNAALWDRYGEGCIEMCRSMGDIYTNPDPVQNASNMIDYAATVLWESRTKE